MSGITAYEFDALATEIAGLLPRDGLRLVPEPVYRWLERQCLQTAAQGGSTWLRLSMRQGQPVVQLTSFVGVIRAPNGFQIEVLPKVGKASADGAAEARQLLLKMLCCLPEFRHLQIESARVLAARLPLLEVFIAEFLRLVQHIVKRGLRGAYARRQDNLFALRGKLLPAAHLRHNLVRADRFFTEHDEFSNDRPEHRLLHTALRRVLALTQVQAHQQWARGLAFVFADIPLSVQPRLDFQQLRLERGMGHYADGLAWCQLILDEMSPLSGHGEHVAPSLLFPMAALFEAFVTRHLAQQLKTPFTHTTQARHHHLVQHQKQSWFQLRPDLLIQQNRENVLVLDTKWKLLDNMQANGTNKYGLLQSDFYQLLAYGHSYLGGQGTLVLIYPKTDRFTRALPVFEFPQHQGLQLWVLPFCLQSQTLLTPEQAPFIDTFGKYQQT
ncbi:McrC family protein [Neisseriaceae bacterium TC5R-5]|nr:McrC family protein [Neisseriaceae bacterium TC5R-5]